MKRAAILVIACVFMSTQAAPAPFADVHITGHVMPPGGSMLASRDTARDTLNATGRHGDWLRIPSGSGEILTFVVYPDRADKAPVLIISEENQPMSDWLRAVADQAAGEGYIALVPDALPGLDQNARIDAARQFAAQMPPANGKVASFTFVDGRIDLGLVTFETTQQGWTDAINFLNAQLENHPALMTLPLHEYPERSRR